MKDFIIGLKVQSGTIWPLILFEDKIHRRATVFLKTAASFPVEFVLISSSHSADLLKRQKVKDDECSWSVLGKTDIILSENNGTGKTAVAFSFKRQQGGPLQVDIRSEDGSFHQTIELPVSENVAVHDVRFPYGTFELQKIPLAHMIYSFTILSIASGVMPLLIVSGDEMAIIPAAIAAFSVSCALMPRLEAHTMPAIDASPAPVALTMPSNGRLTPQIAPSGPL